MNINQQFQSAGNRQMGDYNQQVVAQQQQGHTGGTISLPNHQVQATTSYGGHQQQPQTATVPPHYQHALPSSLYNSSSGTTTVNNYPHQSVGEFTNSSHLQQLPSSFAPPMQPQQYLQQPRANYSTISDPSSYAPYYSATQQQPRNMTHPQHSQYSQPQPQPPPPQPQAQQYGHHSPLLPSQQYPSTNIQHNAYSPQYGNAVPQPQQQPVPTQATYLPPSFVYGQQQQQQQLPQSQPYSPPSQHYAPSSATEPTLSQHQYLTHPYRQGAPSHQSVGAAHTTTPPYVWQQQQPPPPPAYYQQQQPQQPQHAQQQYPSQTVHDFTTNRLAQPQPITSPCGDGTPYNSPLMTDSTRRRSDGSSRDTNSGSRLENNTHHHRGHNNGNNPKPHRVPRGSQDACANGGTQLIVNYLAPAVTSVELHKLFGQFGPLDGARIIYDKATGGTKGYGFVYFKSAASAEAAIHAMNGVELHGKWLKVAYSSNPLSLSSSTTAQHSAHHLGESVEKTDDSSALGNQQECTAGESEAACDAERSSGWCDDRSHSFGDSVDREDNDARVGTLNNHSVLSDC